MKLWPWVKGIATRPTCVVTVAAVSIPLIYGTISIPLDQLHLTRITGSVEGISVLNEGGQELMAQVIRSTHNGYERDEEFECIVGEAHLRVSRSIFGTGETETTTNDQGVTITVVKDYLTLPKVVRAFKPGERVEFFHPNEGAPVPNSVLDTTTIVTDLERTSRRPTFVNGKVPLEF